MNDFEQLEAWIESRIMQRRATREEVYALRRLRRSDTPHTRRLLLAAYIEGVFRTPMQRAAQKLTAQMKSLLPALENLARLLAEAEVDAFEAVDIGEFDNRAHDWLRAD